MENYKANNLADLIGKIHVDEAQKLLPQSNAMGSIKKWMNNNYHKKKKKKKRT